ncbi:hypothetical protein L915_21705, partial [Phytophthora nicotianae]
MSTGAESGAHGKSVVDVYNDNILPYPDGSVVRALATPLERCCYVLKEGIQVVTDELLVNQA